MKIFAIRDENNDTAENLAFLFYYEQVQRFYIEIPDRADPWKIPLILSSFAEKGENTINSYWSRLWVQQRIVPPDRQNIGEILRVNGLEKYDEFVLLMLASGHCEQDDYYLEPIQEDQLDSSVQKRFSLKVKDVRPLEQNTLLLVFQNGSVKKCNLSHYFETEIQFRILASRQEYFEQVQLLPDGYGIYWDNNLEIIYPTLYKIGKNIPGSENGKSSPEIL